MKKKNKSFEISDTADKLIVHLHDQLRNLKKQITYLNKCIRNQKEIIDASTDNRNDTK